MAGGDSHPGETHDETLCNRGQVFEKSDWFFDLFEFTQVIKTRLRIVGAYFQSKPHHPSPSAPSLLPPLFSLSQGGSLLVL